MQNETEIHLKPQTEKPKRKHTRRKPRKTRTRRAEESTFLLMATTVNSGFILLLYVLSFFKVI